MVEEYIYNYLKSRILITGNKDDFILSSYIKYDLNREFNISYHKISQELLKNTLITKKPIKGSMHYIGLKYK
jgi:hypothetical protein